MTDEESTMGGTEVPIAGIRVARAGEDRRGAASRRLLRAAVPLVLVAVAACATVPLTGRRQLSLIDEGQLAEMGAQAYVQMLEKEKLLGSGPAVDQVLRVGRRIVAAAEGGSFDWAQRGEFNWEFSVVDNDEVVNAWALPGGKVAVYTGILNVAQTDAGLATVMGHEIAHAIARHGGERMSQQAALEFGQRGASRILSSTNPDSVEIFAQAYNILGAGAILLPFSRKHESEADHIGLLLMAAAGYDPRESVGFWERMSAGGGSEPPEFLSTHPNHDTRIRNLEKWMPEALEVYRGERSLVFLEPARAWALVSR